MDNKTPSSNPGGKHIKTSSSTAPKAAARSSSAVGRHESGAHAAGGTRASGAKASSSGAKRPTGSASANVKRPSAKTARAASARKKSAAKSGSNLLPIIALSAVLLIAAGLAVWKLADARNDSVTSPKEDFAPAIAAATSSFNTPTATPHTPSNQNTVMPQAQIDEPDDFIDEDDPYQNETEPDEGNPDSTTTLNLFADGEGTGDDLTVVELTPTAAPDDAPDATPTPKPTATPKPVKLDHTYEIEVDKSKQVITVYTVGENGYYDLVVKQFICSTGHCDKVEDGWYKIGEKSRWKKMGNGSYAQFASRISGPYLFHSACYYEQKNSQLKVRYYENLGTNASSGCIRLTAGDAYWIYTNCPKGTPIHVITSGEKDEALLEALQPPALISQKYDPTDPEAPAKYQYKPEVEPTPDPTPVPGVTPAPTPSWTVHPTLKAWGYC